MQRSKKTKGGHKPKARATKRTTEAASTLEVLTQPIKSLFSASPVEAGTAMERLAHSCQWWVLEDDRNRELGKLVRERDQHRYESAAYKRLQPKVNEVAARKVEWDPSWMPLMLLDRRLRELAAAPLVVKGPLNAVECWNVVAPIAAVLVERLEGLPEELEPWSQGVGDGRWCRKRVRANLEAKRSLVRRLASMSQEALSHLEGRDDATRAKDVLKGLKGLRALHAALTFVRAELVEPGLHLKPAAWDVMLRSARDQTRTIVDHWPAGACEPVALTARDNVASRLGIALARLAQPGRSRDPKHAETLEEGIALLDQYIGPICEWRPLPLPIAHLDPAPLAPVSSDPPPSDENLRSGAWFCKAVRKHGGKLVELKPGDLSRKRKDLGARRTRGSSRQWLYSIERVVAHPQFAAYKVAITRAYEEHMPLDRGAPRGRQAKRMPR